MTRDTPGLIAVFVVESDGPMAVGPNVLEHQFPKPLRFFTEGMSRRSVLIPAWWQTASRASRMVSWAVLVLPVLLAGVDAIDPSGVGYLR